MSLHIFFEEWLVLFTHWKLTFRGKNFIFTSKNDKIRPQYVRQKDTKDTIGRYIVLLAEEKVDSCQQDREQWRVLGACTYIVIDDGPSTPIFWCISLQTEISLSTVVAEYIVFYSAPIKVLPMMTIMEEINEFFPSPHFKAKLCLQITWRQTIMYQNGNRD